MTTAKALAPKNGPAPRPDSAALQVLDELATRYSLRELNLKGRFERAVLLAEGLDALRRAVAPLMPSIMRLQNSPLGFLTDKPDGGYPVEVVQECFIEATLRGVQSAGNEWNILVRRCYVTLNGYRRLVAELPGLTDLRLEPGVPKMSAGGAVVPFKASWKVGGSADSLRREIPVRLNAGMGADGAIGKATRKMLASVYAQVTGSGHTAEDAAGDELPTIPAAKEALGGPSPATREQSDEIALLAHWLGLTGDGYDDLCEQAGVDPSRPMTAAEADKVLAALRAKQEQALRQQQEEREAVGAEGA